MMPRVRAWIVSCFVLFLASAASAQGSASSAAPGGIKDRGRHTRPMDLSILGYLPWYLGLGVGVNVRFEIPIVPDGFIPAINDQFSIEPSFSVGFRARKYRREDDRLRYLDITPAVYGVWSFHITPKFRPYGALGIGYDVGIWLNEDDFDGRDPTPGFFYWNTAVGLFYNFSPRASFRAEVGPQGPMAGFALIF